MSSAASTSQLIPVITIDGPSGAGKGTVARRVADSLGFHLLDSGAVYRAAALHAINHSADLDDENSVMASLVQFDAVFTPTSDGVEVALGGQNVSSRLRGEEVAGAASRIAAMPAVRHSLLDEQRSFRQPPGLVADGRDMGSVVFPDAAVKVFLTASAEERARRRASQLKEKGIPFTMARLVQEIEERDRRDSTRRHAPLRAAEQSIHIDSSLRSIDSVVDEIVAAVTATPA